MKLTERQHLFALARRLAYLRHGRRVHDCFKSGPAWSRFQAACDASRDRVAVAAAQRHLVERMRYHVGRRERAILRSPVVGA